MNLAGIIERIGSIPLEVWWKGLSYVLSAFFFIPNITLIMFLIYMGEHDFFSYDFFTEGAFGMEWFFLATALALFGMSILIYSPLLLIFAKKTGKHVKKSSYWIVAFISGIIWLGLIYKACNGEDLYHMAFVLGVCILLMIHLITLIYYNARKQFISLFLITTSIILLSVTYPTQASKVMSIGLQAYGVGGDLPISITNAQSGTMAKGKLKLITPKHIYFSPDKEGGIATYSLNNVSYYVVGGK